MLVLKQLIDWLIVERYLFVHISDMLLHKDSSGICRILHLLKNLSAEAADLFYKCNTVLLSRATQRLEYQTIKRRIVFI